MLIENAIIMILGRGDKDGLLRNHLFSLVLNVSALLSGQFYAKLINVKKRSLLTGINIQYTYIK